MEQRREPERRIAARLGLLDDRERVMQHVLVLVHGILLELQRRQLRQELLGQTGRDHQLEPARGRLGQEQLRELLVDPLGGDDLESVVHLLDRPHTRGGIEFELRGEPRGAEHPQRVVGERDLGIERRVEALGREILHADERIDELTVGQTDRHRVHGEVASRQVGPQVLAERDRRLAVLLRVHLLAERRDLQDLIRPAGAHRAEPHADQVHALGPPAQDLRGLPREGVGREVEVAAGSRPSSRSRTTPPTR